MFSVVVTRPRVTGTLVDLPYEQQIDRSPGLERPRALETGS
jgi:hypothetical protein